MAGSYNKLTIIGHLGHDPEMRYLPDGTALTTFDVAVNERRQVDGQTVQTTQWFHVTCYAKLAETAAEHLRGGRSALVEGPLGAREYVGQAGQKRITLDVRARELRLLDALPRESAAAAQAHSVAPTPAQDRNAVAAGRAGALPDDLDQVPF